MAGQSVSLVKKMQTVEEIIEGVEQMENQINFEARCK